jgi:hypothetical protein
MKISISILSILLSFQTFGQTKTTVVDTIVMLGGRKIPAMVQQVGAIVVMYALPSKPDSIIKIEIKQLEKVIHKNGNIDEFNKSPIGSVTEDKQWQNILTTKNKKEVQGLYKRGLIKAQSNPNDRGNEASKESGMIKLKKQAVTVKATIVLITHDEFIGGPGDPRIYYVEGIAYGNEPLEKETDVAKDPKEEIKK